MYLYMYFVIYVLHTYSSLPYNSSPEEWEKYIKR